MRSIALLQFFFARYRRDWVIVSLEPSQPRDVVFRREARNGFDLMLTDTTYEVIGDAEIAPSRRLARI
jgi:hypothetical protein